MKVNKQKQATLDHTHLLSILSYDPDVTDGTNFTWKESRGSIKKGSIGGTLINAGYWRIKIDGVARLAHRLAWFYVHGVWPKNTIDHIELGYDAKKNNSIANLREATYTEQSRHRVLSSNNTSGYPGVGKSPHGKWHVRIGVDGKCIHLGTYDTLDEAISVKKAAELKYW